ncbi:MAG: arylsulfatase [Gammaproteobacteria bacterium]|nr:arylsulfatase [Gammaproteobacteria bacterium]
MTKPNILLILADDMGFSDIGCFGSEIRTPTLDTLGTNGLRYTQMYNSARCCPSRAALLTGLNPHQAGVGWMTTTLSGSTDAYQGYLNERCVTIAEVLKGAGYRTFLSGKWHVGNAYDAQRPDTWRAGEPGWPTPTQRGFDDFYGTLDGAGSFWNPHSLMDGESFIRPDSPDFYYTDAIGENAAARIEAALDAGTPFFGYVAFTAPHWPLHAREEDIARYADVYRCGWDAIRTARHETQRDAGLVDRRWPISPRDSESWPFDQSRYPDWEALRMAVYAAQIDRMDQAIGGIVATLSRRKALDNTLIFFLSDNGGCAEFLKEDTDAPAPHRYNMPTVDGRPMRVGNLPHLEPGPTDTFMSYDLPWANASNTPFRRYKSWVHEGGISTPFIVHWPGGIAAPAIVHTPIHITDIMPTCVEVAGAPYPESVGDHAIQPMEGSSLKPSFRDSRWQRGKPIWFEHEGNRAVRDGPWKLVNRHPHRWELYNIDDDRTEQHDLAESEKRRVAAMARYWRGQADRVGYAPNQALVDRIADRHPENWALVRRRFKAA